MTSITEVSNVLSVGTMSLFNYTPFSSSYELVYKPVGDSLTQHYELYELSISHVPLWGTQETLILSVSYK